VIYVTDAGQAHFAACSRWRLGPLDSKEARLSHVPSGLVAGGVLRQEFKTRAGDTVRLRDLLDEAVERA